MESLEYLFGGYDLYDSDELLEDRPIGWSSICLDQTINYYIECNSINSQIKSEEYNTTEELN